MRSLGRALVGLGLAGLAIGLLALSLIITSDHTTYRGLFAAFTLVVGWSFIGTGLFAWWRRPENRTGALMTATGFAWFLPAMTASNSPGIFTAGYALNTLAYGLLIQMLVAFPDGRLDHPRPARRHGVDVVRRDRRAVGGHPVHRPTRLSGLQELSGQPAPDQRRQGALGSAARGADVPRGRGARRRGRRARPALPAPRRPPSAARSGRCCGRAGWR